MERASGFHKGHHRKRHRAIPFPFYWNNCYPELVAKHRGGNSIGRYSTFGPRMSITPIKHRIAKRVSVVAQTSEKSDKRWTATTGQKNEEGRK